MSTDQSAPRNPQRIAIACQGGGSHTAFTAGVLKTLVTEIQEPPYQNYAITALSGTSGGAICALLVWYGLWKQKNDGWSPADISSLLNAFWRENAAQAPGEVVWNNWIVNAARLRGSGVLPEFKVSPYSSQATLATTMLTKLAPREEFVDLHTLLNKYVQIGAVQQGAGITPRLVIGAIEVKRGEFTAFDSWRQNVSIDSVIASATLPWLFKAIEIDDNHYWDGLFSQNPPVREFVQGVENVDDKPNQIWVIRLNPKERAELPTTLEAIEDRRNELAGNLSLEQELSTIEMVNRWLERGWLTSANKQHIAIHSIEMSPDVSQNLDYASKLDRSQTLFETLMSDGENQARAFLRRRLQEAH